MIIKDAQFVKSAVWPNQYPLATMPEVAFVGRSNVGKSSLINATVGRKGLAKTSNTPGRTQLVNFFTINNNVSFVDLPGYGFAKVSKSIKKDWGEMIEAYLRERRNLALVIFILDIRRDPSPDDLDLREWLNHYRIPYVFVLTKTDKLSNNQTTNRCREIAKALGVPSINHLVLFSAKTKAGLPDLLKIMDNHLQGLVTPE